MTETYRLHVCVMTRAVVQHHIGGGMELHAEILRRGLVELGHRVTTITTPRLDGLPREEDVWGETLFVGAGSPVTYTREWWQRSLDTLLRINAHDPINVIASEGKAAYTYLGARRRLSAAERTPTVIMTHNTIVTDFRSQVAQLRRRPHAVARWMPNGAAYFIDDHRRLPLADAITVLSENHALSLQRWFSLDPSRITIIPNGVDVAALTAAAPLRESFRQRLGISDSQTSLVLVLARLVKDKGQQFLVEALARPEMQAHQRKIRLVLAGDGPTRGELEARARALGLQDAVHFLGRVPHEEVPGLLASADIVVQPSVAEGMPFSLLEAMASGRPVIASNISSIASFVEDGVTGRLVAVAQPADLAQALSELLSDRQRAADLGIHARDFVVARYDQRNMVAEYEKVLRNAARLGAKLGVVSSEREHDRLEKSGP